MTRAHPKLLGPCFKTGRIGGRLAHRDTASARRGNSTDGQREQSHATAHEAASRSYQQCAQAETVQSPNRTNDRPPRAQVSTGVAL